MAIAEPIRPAKPGAEVLTEEDRSVSVGTVCTETRDRPIERPSNRDEPLAPGHSALSRDS